ncbi:hypothetical protein NPIL_172461 [Nephila pilipes]|uniref:Uncharacterized protein n=1 Tax=Nephila pilipes TaxID=299642 RepID=A0A8X6MWI4_NEPPI|nr:hypothetical protein NPIL_172461 [Nephila pilipes]
MLCAVSKKLASDLLLRTAAYEALRETMQVYHESTSDEEETEDPSVASLSLRRMMSFPFGEGALTSSDCISRTKFGNVVQECDTVMSKLIFSDEYTFHLSGKVNHHIYALEIPKILIVWWNVTVIPPKLTCFALSPLHASMGNFFFYGDDYSLCCAPGYTTIVVNTTIRGTWG